MDQAVVEKQSASTKFLVFLYVINCTAFQPMDSSQNAYWFQTIKQSTSQDRWLWPEPTHLSSIQIDNLAELKHYLLFLQQLAYSSI